MKSAKFSFVAVKFLPVSCLIMIMKFRRESNDKIICCSSVLKKESNNKIILCSLVLEKDGNNKIILYFLVLENGKN